MTSQLQEEIRIRDPIEFFIAIDAKKTSCQARIDKVVQIFALFERPIHLAVPSHPGHFKVGSLAQLLAFDSSRQTHTILSEPDTSEKLNVQGAVFAF